MPNAATAPALAPTKAPHQLEMTRGAVYLLELCLQEMGPCKTPAKTVEVGALWDHIRSLNDRLVTYPWSTKPVDFEKPVLPLPDETQVAYQERVLAKDDIQAEWMAQPQVLALSDKRRDLARMVVKWVIENQGQGPGKSNVRLGRTKNLNVLILALGLAEAEEDEAAQVEE